MRPAQRVGDLKLHADQEGCIWYEERGYEPQDSRQDVKQFVANADLEGPDRIRVIASVQNADLILALHSRDKGKYRSRVWLGNPRMAPSEYRRMSTIFSRMDDLELPSSLGGWRKLIPADYITFALAGKSDKSPEQTDRYLRAHPAWPALSFLDQINKTAACQFICKLLDPRWHVNPAKPDAAKRLQSLFGLGQNGTKNIKHLLYDSMDHPPGRNVDETKIIMDLWSATDWNPPAKEIGVPPKHFLWRLLRNNGSNNFPSSLLRVYRVLTRFVNDVWLDRLSPQREYEPVTRERGLKRPSMERDMRLVPAESYRTQQFIPEHFFRTGAEIKAWYEHCKRCK